MGLVNCMGAVFAFLFCVIVTVALFVASARFFDSDYGFAAVGALILAVIMAFVSFFAGINFIAWGMVKVDIDSSIAYHQAKQIMYHEMIEKYDTLALQDVTASEQHMALYKEILDFNHEVDRVERNSHQWWTEGVLWDPSYVGIDKVPITTLK